LPAPGIVFFKWAASSGSTTRKSGPEKLTSAYVGEVMEINTGPVAGVHFWCGFTPFISPTAARRRREKFYNCNADVAAAKPPLRSKAGGLVFMSDVAGPCLRIQSNPTRSFPHLQTGEVESAQKIRVN